MIGNLEAIVREFIGTERKGTAKTAIVLLGELRANESASLLADNLTFKVFYKETKRLQIVGRSISFRWRTDCYRIASRCSGT